MLARRATVSSTCAWLMEGEVAASGGIVDMRRIPETAEGQPGGELEMFEISMPWMIARLRKG